MPFAAPVRHRCHYAPHLAREGRDCVDAGHHQPRGGVTRHPGGGRVIPFFGGKVLHPGAFKNELSTCFCDLFTAEAIFQTSGDC
jgi:hypothetical protein